MLACTRAWMSQGAVFRTPGKCVPDEATVSTQCSQRWVGPESVPPLSVQPVRCYFLFDVCYLGAGVAHLSK